MSAPNLTGAAPGARAVFPVPSPEPAPPFDEMQGRTGFGARVFALRWCRLGLSQAAFSERFGLSLGMVKDLEQNRWRPARTMVLVIAAIEAAPERMAKIAERERAGLGR